MRRNKEPIVLPSKLPALLLMGAEGIAVGLATTIMPHNFNELLDAQIGPVEVSGVQRKVEREIGVGAKAVDEALVDSRAVEVGAADRPRRGDPRVTEYLGPVDVVVIDRDLSDAFIGSSGGVGDECSVDLRTVDRRAGGRRVRGVG